jgi:hypothetical protein
MLQIHLAALALVAVALVASGCGGSSKSGTSTATLAATTTAAPTPTTLPSPTVKLATGRPLTRAKWIAEADAICAHVNTEAGAISVRSGSEYVTALPQVAVYYSTEAKNLSNLVPPASMAGDHARIVNGLQLFSEYLSKSGQALATGNKSAAGQLYRAAVGVQKRLIAVAKRDGFKRCTATT